MIVYLSIDQVMRIHERVITDSGGSHGVRDLAAVDSAVAQPQQTFFGEDLYPELPEKASALGFSLIQNHPFVDGNKRTGYEAMTLFLDANGYRLSGEMDEKEQVVLALAAGQMGREEFTEWVRRHIVAREG